MPALSIRNLKYRVVEPHKYASEDRIKHADVVASFTLTDGLLWVELNAPADSISDARALVEPIVRSWEFEAEIRTGFPVIKFEFTAKYAASVDEPPRRRAAGSIGEVEGQREELVILLRYPPGPSISVTPEMENIWTRFSRARMGIGEPVQSAVYYSLTVIETHFGSRSKAAAALHFSADILRKMGELSSTRGDPRTARKTRAASKPLSPAEEQWLDYAVRCALLQLGRVAAGLSPPPVTISDLPDFE